MKRQYGFLAALTLAVSLGLGGGALADVGDLVKSCDGCHSGDQAADSNIPSIAGLPEYFHSDQLYLYRDKARPCSDATASDGSTTNMCNVTGDLSDEQIDALAAHYAVLPFVAAKQAFDPALAAAGEKVHARDCEVCHSDGGSNPEDEAGLLAGQRVGYLKATLGEYRAGEREQPEKMQPKLGALSDDDIKALLHYYASQQ